MDKFPEAFERFEEDVDIIEIEGFRELRSEFIQWMGKGWKNTPRQNAALNKEAAGYLGTRQKERMKSREWPRNERFRKIRRIRRGEYAPGVPEPYYIYPATIDANIKAKVKQGYSANAIQRQMRNQGIGIRRQVLLRQIREQRGRPQRQHPEKYTPKKYRKRPQT